MVPHVVLIRFRIDQIIDLDRFLRWQGLDRGEKKY